MSSHVNSTSEWGEELATLWSAVQTAMNAAELLYASIPASSPDSRAAAAENLTSAITAASAAISGGGGSIDATMDDLSTQQLASMATVLQTQLQSLAIWNARNADLSLAVSAAQRTAPRISSFAAARAEAVAAVASSSSAADSSAASKSLKSARTATSVLHKLGGLIILDRLDIEHTDEASGGMPCTATMVRLCVRRATAGAPAIGGEDAMYASEAVFAKMMEVQVAMEAEYIVLQILMLTPTQAMEVDLLSGAPDGAAAASSAISSSSAAVASVASSNASLDFSGARIIRAEVIGLIRANALATLQATYAARGQQEGSKALDCAVGPCAESVKTAVARATRRAVEAQKSAPGTGALDAMLRDLAFEPGF